MNPARRLRFGVIGAGGFAEICHVPGLQSHPMAEVVALCGRRYEHARAMADRLGVPDVHTDFRELCARDDLDAVTIATPNAAHAEPAIAAFAHGKHVFCEKPLSASVAEARAMLQAAEASGRVHLVAFTFRYLYGVRELRRRVRAGEIGQPYYVRMRFDGWRGLHPDRRIGWREKKSAAGGGVLYDMGSHLFDLARFVLGPLEAAGGFVLCLPGEYPEAETGRLSAVETDDLAAAWFRLPGGCRGEWFMSRITPPHSENAFLEVVGTEGALQAALNRGYGERLRVSRPAAPEWQDLPLPPEATDGQPHALGLMMRSFVEACLRGAPNPDLDASFRDGLAAQEALDAVERSGAAGSSMLPLESHG